MSISGQRDERPRRGIRFRLLLSVNAMATLGLGLLLFVDYRQEVRNHIAVIRVALEEEARTLLPALRRLVDDGPAAVQRHVDLVCARMRESSSPGHHIAAAWAETSIQARSHGRESPEMLRAMRQALAQEGAGTGPAEIVVGSDSDGELTVYVSERVSNVVRSARARALQRAVVLVGVIVAFTLAVNVVLVRLVVRPVRALAGTVHEVGTGNLGARAPDSKTAELSVLASEINEMSAALLEVEHKRQREMHKARQIQERLCRIPVHVPGVTVASLYRPAEGVAGDYYDLVPLPDGSWLFCIADVIGHGIPAAMGAAILKTLLVAAAETLVDPGSILAFVNERYCRVSLPEDFATMAVARWDPERSRIVYAGGGHDAGVLRAADGTVQLFEATGMLLGIDDAATWDTRSVPVADGAELLLMTDGVSETRATDGTLFGVERVMQLLEKRESSRPSDTLREIERALERHRGGGAQTDDVTLVLAQFGHAR